MTDLPPKSFDLRCKCGYDISATLGRDFENCAQWTIDEHYAGDKEHALEGSVSAPRVARGFRIGCTRQGQMTSTGWFRGRGWQNKLATAAIAYLEKIRGD